MAMTLSPNARNVSYVALVVVNTTLTVCAERNLIPAGYAHCAAIVSLIVAALMKEFAVGAGPPPPETP
jgi:hypothetical protein